MSTKSYYITSLGLITMKKEEIETHLKRRPAVHELVIGAFIQEPLFYSDNIFAVPLKAIGYEMFARYLVKYSIEIGKANVDKNGITSLINQGINSLPVIAIICFLDKDDSPENLELNAIDDLLRAKEALSWSSGEHCRAASMRCRLVDYHHREQPLGLEHPSFGEASPPPCL